MKYNYDFEVKYQEVDGRKKLRLFNLENYLLEVAGTVADDLGFGIQVLHPRGLTWILTRMSIEIWELPTHNDLIRFETWIESNAHMLSTRDYRIYMKDSGDKSQDWRLIGQCKSIWAVLDMEKREIVNCFDEPIFADSVDGEILEMPRVRMTTIPEPSGCMEHRILYSDIDYNNHCNSCRYLQAMTDAYMPDYYGKRVRVDINYSKEITQGETMGVNWLVTEDGAQYQLKNESGETNCSAKLSISNF